MCRLMLIPLFLAASVLATGCGDDNTPSQDLAGDSLTQDVTGDTVTPVDIPVDDDIPVVTDVPIETDTAEPTVCTSSDQCKQGRFCDADACGGEGACADMPTFCIVPMGLETLCACNGIAYESECIANMDGTNVGTGGDCGSNAACSGDSECPESQYCSLDSCIAAAGTCAAKPTLCPQILSPVCGCNGAIYNNACLAGSDGAIIDQTGEACSTPLACTSDDCPKGFCFKSSCEETATGSCEEAPELCLITGEEVCGCDGNTYSNECLAMKEQISIDPTGVACNTMRTCFYNGDCKVTEYCAKNTCGALTGICTTISTRPCAGTGEAVCGCDGVVYPEECLADKGRVNTTADGCEAGAACSESTPCAGQDEYCLSTACGGDGTCISKPTACQTATFQVCGCDGSTYRNFCEAAKAGVVVAHQGKCLMVM